MCGILGVFSTSPSAGLGRRADTALNALSHRGPDDRGLETFAVQRGALMLGHTRLSIIDLSPGGHQPMHTSDDRFTIVFNGEIYNYRELRQQLRSMGHTFQTDSDTEVLLACWAQWGADSLPRLRGMFAFAVFDRLDQTLTCVRDAFGIKPLFYRLDEGCFQFASEIGALVELRSEPPRLNFQRAYDYLVYGRYDDASGTFFENVHHLLPGHVLVLSLSAVDQSSPAATTIARPSLRRWWWPAIEERTDLSFADVAGKLREMFLQNIRLHLRSDVPLGAALSAGVDSSAIVCGMRHLEPDMPIHTFTFVARGMAIDEEKWADLVNAHVGAIPHKVVISTDEIAGDLDDLIRTQGEPFGGTSIYGQYRVYKLARAHGITVTLDGQGADELLAGYHGYPGPRLLSHWDRGEIADIVRFLRNWSRWPGRSIHKPIGSLLGEIGPDWLYRWVFSLHVNPVPSWVNRAALESRGTVLGPPRAPSLADADCHGRQVAASLRHALTGHGLPQLLRHGDRNAMRWSVESRVPFLTTDMAEFVLTLPEDFLISREGETKSVFREAMRGIVPDPVLRRRDKIGFATPDGAWLRSMSNITAEWATAAEEVPFLRAAVVRKTLETAGAEHRTFNYQTWRLSNFCRWVSLMNPVID